MNVSLRFRFFAVVVVAQVGCNEDAPDEPVATCSSIVSKPCPGGCEQTARVLADGGACATELVLYCGAPVSAGTTDVKCFVRVSDGVVVRVPSLGTKVPDDGSIRNCTPEELERTQGNYVALCK